MYFFFLRYADHQYLHVLTTSFPTRPPSELFNTDMLRGFGGAPVDVSRFSRGNFAAPGDYTVPVIVNDRQVGRSTVRVRQQAGETYPQPCVDRSAEHTSELQTLMRNSYAVYCLKKKKKHELEFETKVE